MLRGTHDAALRWDRVPELVVLMPVMQYEKAQGTQYRATSERLTEAEAAQLVADLTAALAVLTDNAFQGFAAVRHETVAGPGRERDAARADRRGALQRRARSARDDRIRRAINARVDNPCGVDHPRHRVRPHERLAASAPDARARSCARLQPRAVARVDHESTDRISGHECRPRGRAHCL